MDRFGGLFFVRTKSVCETSTNVPWQLFIKKFQDVYPRKELTFVFKIGMYSMWFLYVSIVVFNLAAFLMKKNLPPIEYYASIFWGLFTTEIADRYTDKYDLYYFFNPYFIEAKSLLVILGIYPAATMLILNWYPFNRPITKRFYYIICWSVFSIFYEWLCLESGFLHHKNWNMWLSAISYPFLYALLIGNLKFIRWLEHK